MRVAIVGAVPPELAPLEETLSADGNWERQTEQVYVHKERELAVYTALVGVGKVNSAYRIAEILQSFGPELVVNIGYAGGMLDEAAHGDIVIGNDYSQVDFVSLLQQDTPRAIPGASPYVIPEGFILQVEQASRSLGFVHYKGRIATGDFFLNDSRKKAEIIQAFSPVAFDMESAAIAHVCAKKGVAFVAVRTISDLADDDAHISVKETKDIIEERPVRVVLQALYEHAPALVQQA
ncbi:MAG: Nucleoside phosphorylase [Paenibacillaceae bacterium]|nr:Nucleoside phosphorylase [Paenibacillaceae bacterium]